MGKLSLTFVAVGVAACGSNNNTPVDAHVVVPDTRPIDAPKVFLDAPPVSYDFTCFGMTTPATAADPVTISGETETVVGTSPSPVGGVTVDSFKAGNATALTSVVSDATLGTFATGNLVTSALPLDGYLKGSLAGYRTTYVYPPNKIVANQTMVPVPMVSTTTFAMLAALGITQNDTTNGFMLITVSDCKLKPIVNATLTVKQGNTTISTAIDLGQALPQLAGLYAVPNVPDGDTTIGGSYSGMTFPEHVVHAYKQPSDVNSVGTVTVSAVVPGFF